MLAAEVSISAFIALEPSSSLGLWGATPAARTCSPSKPAGVCSASATVTPVAYPTATLDFGAITLTKISNKQFTAHVPVTATNAGATDVVVTYSYTGGDSIDSASSGTLTIALTAEDATQEVTFPVTFGMGGTRHADFSLGVEGTTDVAENPGTPNATPGSKTFTATSS